MSYNVIGYFFIESPLEVAVSECRCNVVQKCVVENCDVSRDAGLCQNEQTNRAGCQNNKQFSAVIDFLTLTPTLTWL